MPAEIRRLVIPEGFMPGGYPVFLEEEGSGDVGWSFPIMVGPMEISALNRAIWEQQTPRPMTHDTLAATIDSLGGSVRKLVVSDLVDHTFIGTLVIGLGGRIIEIDCRPSDGMILATMAKAPIFVEDVVLQKLADAMMQ